MFFRFLLVGGTGFAIDAGLTCLLIMLNVSPWLSRVPAIAFAMTFTWLANRHFTYGVRTARTAGEAFRYASIASVMALANYMIYLVLVTNGMPAVVAVAMATTLQTILSFYSYQHLVFGEAN